MKIFKRCMAFLLVFSMLSIAPFYVLADETNVTINGVSVVFPGGQGPVLVEGRTLVPVRGVFEALGFNVRWDGTTDTAVISNELYEILITVGSPVFITNGTPHPLDVPAQNVEGRTMVPIRRPLESVGLNVRWYGGTVIITGEVRTTAEIDDNDDNDYTDNNDNGNDDNNGDDDYTGDDNGNGDDNDDFNDNGDLDPTTSTQTEAQRNFFREARIAFDSNDPSIIREFAIAANWEEVFDEDTELDEFGNIYCDDGFWAAKRYIEEIGLTFHVGVNDGTRDHHIWLRYCRTQVGAVVFYGQPVF